MSPSPKPCTKVLCTKHQSDVQSRVDPGVGNIQWQTSAASQSPQFPLASHNADIHHLFNLIRLLILLLILLILLILSWPATMMISTTSSIHTSNNTAADTSHVTNTFLSQDADRHLFNLMLVLPRGWPIQMKLKRGICAGLSSLQETGPSR